MQNTAVYEPITFEEIVMVMINIEIIQMQWQRKTENGQLFLVTALFGCDYGKLFENQTRLIGQAKTNPQMVTWLKKTYSLHKILQEKTSPKKIQSHTS